MLAICLISPNKLLTFVASYIYTHTWKKVLAANCQRHNNSSYYVSNATTITWYLKRIFTYVCLIFCDGTLSSLRVIIQGLLDLSLSLTYVLCFLCPLLSYAMPLTFLARIPMTSLDKVSLRQSPYGQVTISWSSYDKLGFEFYKLWSLSYLYTNFMEFVSQGPIGNVRYWPR